MNLIRKFLRLLLLFLDRITSPKGIIREEKAQREIDQRLAGLKLYQFEACPFCIKVRRFLRANSLSLPLIDAKVEPHRSELINGGGKYQTPCLQITGTDGSVQWLYESKDIISFLEKKCSA